MFEPLSPADRIVFTGGPGSGKTTTLEYLKQQGFAGASEVGRAVIRQQVEQQGRALPWLDREAFLEEMIRAEVARYGDYPERADPVFFDRGLIDCLGYARLEGLALPPGLDGRCRSLRYHPQVFLFPPWQEIFVNDAERKQSFADAERTCEHMLAVYQQYGYQVTEVPTGTVAERASFILSRLGLAESAAIHPGGAIAFRPALDKAFAEALSRDNMASYYSQAGMSWDPGQFERDWRQLDNLEITAAGQVIGVIQLGWDDLACYVRNLQICSGWQGQGIGTQAIEHVVTRAHKAGIKRLRLRVFPGNPAVMLYQRLGFQTLKTADGTHYMEKRLSA
ncbi:GNAT family N-acetyltransferase [Marinobacter xestospongiae]|uniref:GNAT family N-acetyltransferase n=1 Tax=Marinobacter xestospongiae TaxID=994319 RepID=A0ABU3VWD1_9GAMM|nr:GNAT family N-acetyltransferase [Marinobacter xestospongiae]MDV2078578.1 GNAT family N-acetyltransferase [Marinobacter xestospongiae]